MFCTKDMLLHDFLFPFVEKVSYFAFRMIVI